ncbi:MAG: ABC transporter permease [Chloroflexi bacterium]|nr:ABC transporter permease [Chloroflexota bacterium]
MTRYVLRRVLVLLPVWLTVYTLTFTLYHLTPGGPWDRERPVPPQAIEHLNRKYGLDRPLWQQYVDYLQGVVTRFDFGPSYKNLSRSVGDIILDFFPTSARIGLLATALAIGIGLPLGVVAAIHHRSAADHASMLVAVLGVSVPSFVVGPLLIWVFALGLAWLPPGGIDGWRNYVLPAVTLSLFPLALVARTTRAALLETLRSDYVRTARAKGLRESLVVRRHALKNALIPVVTIGGLLLAELLVGSFYVETVFAVPGIGRYFITSVTNRDYPVLMGVTLLMTTVVALVNLLVDVLYAYLDPRIRYG